MYTHLQILEQITVDVCQSMLGIPLTPADQMIRPENPLVASVEIRGDHSTSVDVIADVRLAESIAELMFGTELEMLTRAEVRDAMGEIANMIGGNLKGVLGGEADLSIPIVREGTVEVPLNPAVSSLTFDCVGNPLTVVLRDLAEPPSLATMSS